MKLPESVEAEQALFAAILMGPEHLAEVRELVREDDFSRPCNRHLFAAICRMDDRGEPLTDTNALCNELERAGHLEAIGGRNYFTLLMDLEWSGARAVLHAKRVQELAVRRRLVKVAYAIYERANEQSEETAGEESEDLVAWAEEQVRQAGAEVVSGRLVQINSDIEAFQARQEELRTGGPKLAGLDTGFDSLNRITGGMRPKDLTLLAARPSMGKSSLAVNIAAQVADAGGTVAFFSLEMSREAVLRRLVQSYARVPSDRLDVGALSGEEHARVQDAINRLWDRQIWVDETAANTPAQIRARSRSKKGAGLDLIVIDHLGEMRVPGTKSDYERVSAAAESVKALAKDLQVPVLCLAQLSRAVERRDSKRPMMSDLRESGRLEEVADGVWLLYRPSYYEHNAGDRPPVEPTELIVAKHRDGRTGVVNLDFHTVFTTFHEQYQGDAHE